MAWLDDRIRDHPKIRRTTPQAFKFWALALCYCSAHGTEGQLDDAIANLGVPRKVVDELVELRLWDREDDGLWVHDWQEHNEKRDQAVEERRKQARERQRRHRERVRESRVTPRDNPVTVTRDAKEGSPQPVTRDGPRGRAPARDAREPARSRDHDQEEELKAEAAPVTPHDPATDAAAADLHEELEQLLDDLAIPNSLRQRADAEPERALAVARYTIANNGSGAYFRTVFDSGDHPDTGTPAHTQPKAPAINGSGQGAAHITALIDNGVINQMYELRDELDRSHLTEAEREPLLIKMRALYTQREGHQLPADELEHALDDMGAGDDELVELLDLAADLRRVRA